MSALDFANIAPDEWLAVLPEYQRSAIQAMLAAGHDHDKIAMVWLTGNGPENTAPFGAAGAPKNFLNSVKLEMRKLICGDAIYDDLRKQIGAVWDKGRLAVISLVAMHIGNAIGIATVAIVPVVAVILATATKIGVNAWCQTQTDKSE